MKTLRKKINTSSFYLAFSGWGLTKKGLANNKKGEWWLLSQILIIFAHFLPAWPSKEFSDFPYLLILEIVGIGLFLIGVKICLNAFASLGESLSPLPEPKPNAKLKMDGAYRNCRHPLYKGLLICSFSSVIYFGSLLHFSLTLLLVGVLSSKAKKEEEGLLKVHPEYVIYRKYTPAIIPYILILDWRK